MRNSAEELVDGELEGSREVAFSLLFGTTVVPCVFSVDQVDSMETTWTSNVCWYHKHKGLSAN